MDEKPIILWAHARSLSTVFERPFLNFPEEFHVIHEPFVPINHAYMNNDLDYLNKISMPEAHDKITYNHYLSSTLNNILKPHYFDNNNKTSKLRVFVKDLAKMFLQLPDIDILLSKEILSKFKHTFLIRDPEKSVKSFYKS